MTSQRDLDALLTDFLADGMTVLPDRVADAVVGEAQRTRQRTMVGRWRTASVLRAAFGATAVLVVLAIAVGLLDMRGKTHVAAAPESTQPGASASAPADTPTPEPTPTAHTAANGRALAGARAHHVEQPERSTRIGRPRCGSSTRGGQSRAGGRLHRRRRATRLPVTRARSISSAFNAWPRLPEACRSSGASKWRCRAN